MDGADGGSGRTHDGGEEGDPQQGERQRYKGDQGGDKADEAAGGTAVPDLLGGSDGGNAAAQSDIEEIDAVADGGFIIVGIGVGAIEAVSGPNRLHGNGSAGRGGHSFLTGEGCGAGIAIHKVGAGGNIGGAAGAVGELKAGGVLAGILHAPQKTGEFIVGALNGADIDRCGIQRKNAVFGSNAIVGQVIDIADIVIITGEYHRSGQYNPGVHRCAVGCVSSGCFIGACRKRFSIGCSIGCLPFGIGKISALLNGSGAHGVAQHTDLGQIDKVVIFELLQGGVAAEIGSVIFHIAHFRLLVSVRGQGAFSVAVHIQRHDHISAAAQFNGVGFHGIQAGSVAVAQQDRRCRGFGRGCFGDIELGMAGGAHIGGEGQIFGADGAAAGLNIMADDRGDDHEYQADSQHNGGSPPLDRGFA